MSGLRRLKRTCYKNQAFADKDVATGSMKLFRHYWKHRNEATPFQLAYNRTLRKRKSRKK